MQSKTSYFNPTLFRKNLARFWPLWGGASLIGALFPLAFLTILLREGFREVVTQGLEVTSGYYEILAHFVPALSLVYAALCALAVWHFLYNPRSVGLMHSLPITRMGLFVTNFLSGMAMMLIPYAVTGGLAILVTLLPRAFEPVGVGVTILGVLGESFFYFASATLIIFITGNPFAFAALYFIFHFLAAAAEWLVSLLMTTFYFGVEAAYEGVLEFLSPTLYLTKHVNALVVYHQITTPAGWIENGEIESVTLVNGHLIALYALVGVALLGCAWALYRRRRSESAGDVVAVGWMKPVFRYGFALCAAVSAGMLLYILFFADFEKTFTAGVVPMAFCMAVAGVLGYYIASMLLAKSLRVFRGSWKGALGTVLAAAALCAVIAADPFGLERWTPAAEDVEGVTFFINGNRGSISGYVEDPAAVQRLLSAHQAVVAEREDLNFRRRGDRWFGISVHLTYRMGEKNADRYYAFYVSPEQMKLSDALGQVAALFTDPAMQEANIFGGISGENQEARLVSGRLYNLYNTETSEREQRELTLEEARTLEAAVRRDIEAGHFGRCQLLVDSEEYNRSVYANELEFYYTVTRRDSGQTYSNTVYFSFSVYCTETLKALSDLGIVDGTSKLLTQKEWDDLVQPADEPAYYGDYSYPDEVVGTESAVVYAVEG